ncbi:MAG: hypothetical protein ACM3SY_03265 [Candidatus Omnitrophota bacterium]
MKTPGQWPVEIGSNDFQSFLNFLRTDLRSRYHTWKEQSATEKKENSETWLHFWDEELHNNYLQPSILNEPRKREIMARWPHDIEATIHAKEDALEQAKKAWAGLILGSHIDLLKNEAAWYSVNETSSPMKYRFQIGFRNRGCRYWRENPTKLGCLNCGYFFETTGGFSNIGNENFLNQFDTAFKKICKDVEIGAEPAFDVIEFLSDGSFLNDEEVPQNVRRQLFTRINRNKRITKILIETRPEYLDEKKIRELLGELKRGQKLEIAMGLECTDPFVLDFCINKGYGLNEVREAAALLAGINQNHGNRCSLQLYLLLKPAYLTEREALDVVMDSGRELKIIALEYPQLPIVMKLEPVVVPQGTILEVLSRQETGAAYHPPSYWTVLEVLARFTEEGMGSMLRIGAREDMDRYFDIPAAYYKQGDKRGMLSRYDFLLYEAVQEFNIHHDFFRTLIPLAHIFHDTSLDHWQSEIGLDEPVFLRLIRDHHPTIALIREQKKEYYDQKDLFTTKLTDVLTRIEYGVHFQELAQQYSHSQNYGDLEQLTRDIKDLLHRELDILPKHIKINNKFIAFIHNELRILRMHIKIVVKHNDFQDVRSIWIGIPSKKFIAWKPEE